MAVPSSLRPPYPRRADQFEAGIQGEDAKAQPPAILHLRGHELAVSAALPPGRRGVDAAEDVAAARPADHRLADNLLPHRGDVEAALQIVERRQQRLADMVVPVAGNSS